MAKKSDYSLFINFFFNPLKTSIIHYFLNLIFHYSLFFGSIFTVHYKKGHYSLIILPHPDPHACFKGCLSKILIRNILGTMVNTPRES